MTEEENNFVTKAMEEARKNVETNEQCEKDDYKTFSSSMEKAKKLSNTMTEKSKVLAKDIINMCKDVSISDVEKEEFISKKIEMYHMMMMLETVMG